MLEGLFRPHAPHHPPGDRAACARPKRLPEAGRGLGQAIRGSKESIAAPTNDRDDPPPIERSTDAEGRGHPAHHASPAVT